jgi:hypothetical protein
MGYIPVQRDAGRIMYESAMQRAGTIGGAVSGLFQALNQQQQAAQAAAEAKAEEARQFNAKLKAVEALMQTHKDKFKLNDEQLKQFLTSDPAESPKDRYLRLGGFIEGSMKAAELEKTQAETKKLTTPTPQSGQLMTLEDFRKIPSDVDASAEPVPGRPGVVMVTKLNLRAPASQKLTPVDLGGEIAFVDDKGQVVRREPKTAAIPAGYETVGGAAPAPAAATQLSAPAPAMAQRAEAPVAGPAILGRFMSPSAAPATAQAIRAMTPTAGSVQAGGGISVRPMRGSPQEAELLAKQAEEARTQERKIESADAILDTINTLKPKVSMTSVGPGAYTKGIKGTPAKDVEALLKNIQAKVAFNELRSLKEDKTSLGQVAIKEIELLQNAITALDQDMSPELFGSQLNDLENKIKAGRQRLLALEADRRSGLKAPSDTFYRLGGKTVDDYNRQEAAATAIQDPLKALEAAGWGIKR